MNESAVCRIHFEHRERSRWLRLTLSLRDDVEEGRFLVYSPHFICGIDGLDDLALTYNLENWESGIMSGAFYAFRKLGKPLSRLFISDLRGQLQSDDMEVLATASAAAITRLFGGDLSTKDVPEWRASVELLPSQTGRAVQVVNGDTQDELMVLKLKDHIKAELHEQLENQKHSYYDSFVS